MKLAQQVLIKYCAILLLFISSAIYGQVVMGTDTITVMHYNVLQYNVLSGPSCIPPSATVRNPFLSSVLGYVKPQIFTVNEVQDSQTSADVILSAVTAAGIGSFKRAPFISEPNDQLNNMLYYNDTKFSLVSSTTIGCNPRQANLYTLKHSGTLSGVSGKGSDTYLHVIVVHLKASNTVPDAAVRATCTQNIMNYINQNFEKTENFLIQGDFNLYNSDEAAYQNLLDASRNIYFNDPINRPGAWSNNSAFASIHTQSTRLTTSDCFIGGGADDRFDFILANKAIMNDSFHVKYIPNTYKVIGQNGSVFNKSVNDASNSAAPAAILQALYEISDHYPVSLKLSFTVSTLPGIISKKDPSIIPSVLKGPYFLGSGNTLSVYGSYYTFSGTVLNPGESPLKIGGIYTYLSKPGGVVPYNATLTGNFSIKNTIMILTVTSVSTTSGVSDTPNLGFPGLPNPFAGRLVTSSNSLTISGTGHTVSGTYKFSNGTSRITITGFHLLRDTSRAIVLIGSSTVAGNQITVAYEYYRTVSGVTQNLAPATPARMAVTYNNPAGVEWHLHNSSDEEVYVRVWHISGIETDQFTLPAKSSYIRHTPHWQPGTYIIHFRSPSEYLIRKLIKL